MTNTVEVLSLGETKICHDSGFVVLSNEVILLAAELTKETAGIDKDKDDDLELKRWGFSYCPYCSREIEVL